MSITGISLIVWGVGMTGYLGYKIFGSHAPLNRPTNDLSKRIRKIKIKNEKYLTTKSIFK